jgi:hypothetical protein
MCARIDGNPGPAASYDVEPASNEIAPPSTSATTAVDGQTEAPIDPSGATGKRFESSLEASFFRGQLDQAQRGPGVGVLYDKNSHDPAKGADETKAPKFASVVGTKLGTGKDGKELQVKKDIGSPEGYDDEREAIAAARMAGTEPAAVVKINDKWHAVETSADPSYADGAGTTRQHSEGGIEVQGLPPYSDVQKQASKIAASRDRLQAEADIARYKDILDKPMGAAEAEKNRKILKSGVLGKSESAKLEEALPENRKQVEQKLKDLEQKYPTRLSDAEKNKLTDQLAADRQAMAPLLFGLPKSQIQFNSSTDRDDPDKMINIDPMPPSKTGDILGREHYPQNQGFQPGLKPTFGIKLEEMDDPKGAAGVLFHETSHLKDDELAQQWVKQYQDTGHTFVGTKEGLPAFQKWMDEQVGKQLPTQPPSPPLSKADKELVVDKAYGFTATSEARAYVHAAIAGAQSGDKAEAISQLKTYAQALKDGRAASPANGSEVQAALTRELQDLYRKHPELRDSLQAAVDAAKAANPGAWISQVKFSK